MLSKYRQDIAQVLRGFLMGGADIIPGVSGGTVALVLGIYQRLVTAISRIDGHFFKLALSFKWREAAEYIDLRFLVPLGVGVLGGVGSLAGLMKYLLTEQRSYTLAVFFGLILGSSFIVSKLVRPVTSSKLPIYIGIASLSAIFAYWLVGLEQVGFHDNLVYFFFCGAVAICAMILPGISGAYILWLLGAYIAVTDIIHKLLKLEVTGQEFLSLAVFGVGCAIGLVSFSKLLKWLLEIAKQPVMACLGGFMIGSLRLMWPFQIDTTPEIEKLKLKRFAAYLPETWTQEVTICLLLACVATIGVLLLESFGTGVQEDESKELAGD